MTDPSLLDRAALDRLIDWGGAELRTKMIDLFFENGRERVDGVRAGLEGGDLELAERSAHSLKSSAGTLGAERVRSLAGRMEELLESGDPEGAKALLVELEERFEETLEALEAEQKQGEA